MAKRIYVNPNNYLIIANNADLSDDVRNSASNIYTEVNGTLFLFYRKNPSALLESIQFEDILDVEGNAYSSLEAFRDIVESASALIPVSEDPKDLMLEIPRGNVPNHFAVNKFGANPDITKDTREDIWDGGGDYPYPATALVTHISQKVDQSAMRGANIELQGLDANWDLVTQSIPLGATLTTTPQTLATPLLRIFRMKINANVVGTSLITAHNAANTLDYAIITPDNNQTLMALYSVPAGHTAYATDVYGDVVEATGKEPKSTEFNLWVKDNVNGYAFQLKSARGVPKAGSAIVGEFKPYLRIPEKSDIKVSAYCANENGHVHAGFDLIVVKD